MPAWIFEIDRQTWMDQCTNIRDTSASMPYFRNAKLEDKPEFEYNFHRQLSIDRTLGAQQCFWTHNVQNGPLSEIF